MPTILAVDPGPTESAYCLIDAETRQPLEHRKIPNRSLAAYLIFSNPDTVAIEMISSYGMAVGAEVFDTCVWIGRFDQVCRDQGVEAQLVKRGLVKMHLCHSTRANDSNIRQALVDRFSPGQANHGKGTKAAPGWFHGFAADVWAAYALAVYVADLAAQEAAA